MPVLDPQFCPFVTKFSARLAKLPTISSPSTNLQKRLQTILNGNRTKCLWHRWQTAIKTVVSRFDFWRGTSKIASVRLWHRPPSLSRRKTSSYWDLMGVRGAELSTSNNLSWNSVNRSSSIFSWAGRYLLPSRSITPPPTAIRTCQVRCMLWVRRINIMRPFSRWAQFWNPTMQTRNSPLLVSEASPDTCHNRLNTALLWMETQWHRISQELATFWVHIRRHCPRYNFLDPLTLGKSSKLSILSQHSALQTKPTMSCWFLPMVKSMTCPEWSSW